jgi:hypothetical protein
VRLHEEALQIQAEAAALLQDALQVLQVARGADHALCVQLRARLQARACS